MALVDPKALDVFRAVAKAGSATRAAVELNTSQPSVTRTIADLERSCGFRLFERGRYGMTLTAEGEALLGSVERNFAGLRSIQKTIGDIRGGAIGALRAIALPTVAEGVLGALLGQFIKTHPDVAVQLTVAPPDEVLRSVLHGAVDFGAIVGEPPSREAIASVTIDQRALVAVTSPNHPLAGQAKLRFEDLDGEALILVTPPHNIRAAIEGLILEHGTRPRIVHEAVTQRGVAQLALHSQAVGFVDSQVVKEIGGAMLRAIPLEPSISWPINLVYSREHPRSRAFQSFMAWQGARLQRR